MEKVQEQGSQSATDAGSVQIFDPQTAIMPHVATEQPQSNAPEDAVFDLLRKAADETQEVIEKAVGIAGHLNHQQLKVCHLLLSLTLTAEGLDRLRRRGLDSLALQESSWQELETIEHGPHARNAPAFSDNVRDLLRAADSEACKRALENRKLQIDDLLEAITKGSLAPRFAHYFSLDGIFDPAKETFKIVHDLKRTSDKQLDQLGSVADKLGTVKHIANVSLGIAIFSMALLIAGFGFLMQR